MATPIGHALAGYSVYLFCERSVKSDRLQWMLLALFMANAPDLDFLPGFLVGSPALYHQSVTHSLGFALAVSVGAAYVYSLAGRNFVLVFRLCLIAYLSHLAIDFFGPDGRFPYGLPLFWPVTTEHFISPVPIFWGTHHAKSTDASRLEWIEGILNIHNVRAIVLEIALIAPLLLVATVYGKRLVKSVK